jgi:hypothetical protein
MKKINIFITIFAIIISIIVSFLLVTDIIDLKQKASNSQKLLNESREREKAIIQYFQLEKQKWIEEQRKLSQTNSIQKSEDQKIIDKFDIVINYLIKIESDGNPNKISDHGLAVGILQIHPIMVKDVNRILGFKKYNLNDRLCPNKSKEMAKIFFKYYTNENWSNVKIARCWNGGPDGHQEWSTEKYGNRFLKSRK